MEDQFGLGNYVVIESFVGFGGSSCFLDFQAFVFHYLLPYQHFVVSTCWTYEFLEVEEFV